MPGVTPAEVLSNFGITLVEDPADNQPRLLVDLPAAELVEYAIRREEGRMASNGALVIETGERTGRSPNDRFIVDTPDVHDKTLPSSEDHGQYGARGQSESAHHAVRWHVEKGDRTC